MKTIKTIMLLALTIFYLQEAFGVVFLGNVRVGCNYYGESLSEQIYGFESDNEAKNAIDRIIAFTGLPQNFTIMAANVSNAAAVIKDRKRLILYSQDFMLRIKNVTNTDWAALSIMAHEIGHHLSGHTLESGGSRPPTELEADDFSGFILHKMGAMLDDAQAAMRALPNNSGSSTHPPKSARLAAITHGWRKAQEQGGKILPSPTSPIMQPRYPKTQPAPVVVQPQYPNTVNGIIATRTLDALINNGGSQYMLIDSRYAEEYNEGHIVTATSLPYNIFYERSYILPSDKNKLLVFYCHHETCYYSIDSVQKAREAGYTNVVRYAAGINGWIASGRRLCYHAKYR